MARKRPEPSKPEPTPVRKTEERRPSQYQVSWLKEGVWVPEEETRTSFGRKALVKTLSGSNYKVRAA